MPLPTRRVFVRMRIGKRGTRALGFILVALLRRYPPVAQQIEQRTPKAPAAGANPAGGTE